MMNFHYMQENKIISNNQFSVINGNFSNKSNDFTNTMLNKIIYMIYYCVKREKRLEISASELSFD